MIDERQRRPLLIVLLSGLTFFYFLIFAQFGFLHLLEEIEESQELMDWAMLAMGVGGIASCLLTARWFRIEAARSWILVGFAGSCLAAVSSIIFDIGWIQVVVALAVGVFLGALTVAIVPVIRVQAPFGQVGRWVSIGVGFAYFSCNVPMIFESSATMHCLYGAIACGIGVGIVPFLPYAGQESLDAESDEDKSDKALFATRGVLLIATLFMGLIWLDSAAFFLIQQAGEIRMKSWGADWQLWMNAVVHLCAALVGGWLLDRGRLFSLLIGAFTALATGYWLVGRSGNLPIMGVLVYISGVSLYSTALVAYGALAAESPDSWSVSGRAGLVFALGGWFGSAMGIGMASELGRIPTSFMVVSAIALVGFAMIRIRLSRKAMDCAA